MHIKGYFIAKISFVAEVAFKDTIKMSLLGHCGVFVVNFEHFHQKHIQNPVQSLRWSFLQNSRRRKANNFFREKFLY